MVKDRIPTPGPSLCWICGAPIAQDEQRVIETTARHLQCRLTAVPTGPTKYDVTAECAGGVPRLQPEVGVDQPDFIKDRHGTPVLCCICGSEAHRQDGKNAGMGTMAHDQCLDYLRSIFAEERHPREAEARKAKAVVMLLLAAGAFWAGAAGVLAFASPVLVAAIVIFCGLLFVTCLTGALALWPND